MINQTEQLLEYAEYLYGAALNLCKNEQEAADIVQETYLAAIKTMKNGGKIDNIKPWLLTVLKRRFFDKLRHNYSVTYVNIDAVPEIADERDEFLQIEKSEEAKAVRRALSMLCSTYRHVMVGYYVDNKSIKQLSRELSLPENTVKSRLNLGRKQMKKEITMDKSYTNQSYSPKHICICMSGKLGLNNEPQSLVKQDDLLTQNILYYAYDEPKTETEIAKALGVSVGYIEPVVTQLVEGELMKRSGGKVYTDFLLQTPNDCIVNPELQISTAQKCTDYFGEYIENALSELRKKPYYLRQTKRQQQSFELFAVTRMLDRAVIAIRDDVADCHLNFADYPDRPNGGKWFAKGTVQAFSEDMQKYVDLFLNGEYSADYNKDFYGLSHIGFRAYGTKLCEPIWSAVKIGDAAANDSLRRMLYAVHFGIDINEMKINPVHIKYAKNLEKASVFCRDESGELKMAVPVLDKAETDDFIGMTEKYINIMRENIGDRFDEVVKKGKIHTPTHIKSIPKWQKYLNSVELIPVALIEQLHSKGRLLQNSPLENIQPMIVLMSK